MQLCICHHDMLLTSCIITELDSVFQHIQEIKKEMHFQPTFIMAYICPMTLHMPRILLIPMYIFLRSFKMLVGLLKESLMVEQEMASLWGSAIIPELCVYVTLQYLAGGLYMDIFYLVSILQALFYCLLWKTIKAINNCPELWISWPYTNERQLDCATGFTSISTNHALWDCVAVLDG